MVVFVHQGEIITINVSLRMGALLTLPLLPPRVPSHRLHLQVFPGAATAVLIKVIVAIVVARLRPSGRRRRRQFQLVARHWPWHRLTPIVILADAVLKAIAIRVPRSMATRVRRPAVHLIDGVFIAKHIRAIVIVLQVPIKVHIGGLLTRLPVQRLGPQAAHRPAVSLGLGRLIRVRLAIDPTRCIVLSVRRE